jgi:hypothetical protein
MGFGDSHRVHAGAEQVSHLLLLYAARLDHAGLGVVHSTAATPLSFSGTATSSAITLPPTASRTNMTRLCH